MIERNPDYFLGAPQISTFRSRIVPDAVVRALELRKGSADLACRPSLMVTERPGGNFAYLGLNFEDPILALREVRQALAFATDREFLIGCLLHGEVRIASGILRRITGPANRMSRKIPTIPLEPKRFSTPPVSRTARTDTASTSF